MFEKVKSFILSIDYFNILFLLYFLKIIILSPQYQDVFLVVPILGYLSYLKFLSSKNNSNKTKDLKLINGEIEAIKNHLNKMGFSKIARTGKTNEQIKKVTYF